MTRTWADPDLWGHVRFGADMVRSGTLTRIDPYSFTSDVRWINHEWLAEVLLYAAWTSGGSGLIAFKTALLAGTLGFILLTLRGRRVPSTTRDLAVVAALFGLWPRVFVFRPQLFSVLLFAALLWILTSAERGRPARLWIVPPLFALWANLHGGWIVGLGTLVLWSAATLAIGPPVLSRGVLAAITALSVLATLANPYGIGLWAFIGGTVRISRLDISDWRPLWDGGAQVIAPWLISAGLAGIALVRGGRRVPIVHAAVVVGLGAASIRVNRLDVFFTLSAVILLTPYLSTPADSPLPQWSRRHVLVATALAALLASGAWWTRATLSCARLDGPWMPEREAGGYIAANHLRGRLVTWFDWGEYAIWHFAPSLQVSLDGRRETVYSQPFVARHLRMYFEPDQSGDLLRELRADYVWLPRDLPLATFLERRGWHRLFTGPVSVILGRAQPSQQAAPVLATRACFPGP